MFQPFGAIFRDSSVNGTCFTLEPLMIAIKGQMQDHINNWIYIKFVYT